MLSRSTARWLVRSIAIAIATTDTTTVANSRVNSARAYNKNPSHIANRFAGPSRPHDGRDARVCARVRACVRTNI